MDGLADAMVEAHRAAPSRDPESRRDGPGGRGVSGIAGRAFTKMSGGGNDFVVFDDREGWFPRDEAGPLVARLCRRGLGVGADAVVLLRPDSEVDFRMVYYNADGGEAPMCG